jgi:uncharacterized protein with HEPN domain
LLRDAERLAHIVESGVLLRQYLLHVDFDRFGNDPLRQDAVLRRLIVIGEAAGKITSETVDRFPAIPWRIMADFRNFAVHEYHRIDWGIVWTVATERLPALYPALEKAFAAMDAEDQES